MDASVTALMTGASRTLLDDIAPSLDPLRCPLSGEEHETYGGLCHCGWATSRPRDPGRRRAGSPEERLLSILAIERQAQVSILRELREIIRVSAPEDRGALAAIGELLTRLEAEG